MSDETTQAPAPGSRASLAFCLILGLMSVIFAEVVSGSDQFPLFHPWGILVTTPLYALHAAFLAGLLARARRASWRALLYAGALFGLYEAYVTKVLWNPFWAPELAYKIGGVAWPHFVMLVPWWHAFMAFILPLLLAETFLVRDALFLHGLPPRLRRMLATPRSRNRLAVAAAVICGACAAAGRPAINTVAAIAANGAVILAVFALWRRGGRHARYDMAALLPGKRGLIACGALLALLYIVTGVWLQPQALPAWDGHVTILACYAIPILFLMLEGDAPAARDDHIAAAFPAPSLTPLARAMAIALIVALPVLAAGNLRVLIYLANWSGAFVVGVPLYIVAFRQTWRLRKRGRTASNGSQGEAPPADAAAT